MEEGRGGEGKVVNEVRFGAEDLGKEEPGAMRFAGGRKSTHNALYWVVLAVWGDKRGFTLAERHNEARRLSPFTRA